MPIDEIVEVCGMQHLCKEAECRRTDYKLCSIYQKMEEAIYRDSMLGDNDRDMEGHKYEKEEKAE